MSATVEVVKSGVKDFSHGQTTVGATAVKLVETSHAVYGVAIVPSVDTGQSVYVGGVGVTAATGLLVPAGGILIPVSDPSKLFVVATAADQTVTWMVL
jgi:hypothetical protein